MHQRLGVNASKSDSTSRVVLRSCDRTVEARRRSAARSLAGGGMKRVYDSALYAFDDVKAAVVQISVALLDQGDIADRGHTAS